MGFTITVWVGVRKYDKRWAPKDEPHINIGSAWKIVTQYTLIETDSLAMV